MSEHLPISEARNDAGAAALLRRAEELVDAQRHVLEMVACGESLDRCLEELCLGIERVDPAVRAGVALLTGGGTEMLRFVAPRLPLMAAAFAEAPMGDGWMGTCARAALTGEPAHCANISDDARWSDAWKATCLSQGVRAASSTPVMGPEGRAIGTVCLCFDRPKAPTESDLRLTAMASSVAGLVIRRDAMDRALRESERRHRAIVESQAEMVCRFRPEGEILFVNAAYARARGVTPEQLIGANFWSFIEPSDQPAVRALLARVRAESPVVRIENRFETAEGVRWTLWTNRGLTFDAAGAATEIQSSGIDITDRKAAEEALRESEERFRTLADNISQLAWMGDETGHLFWYNRRWYEYTGSTFESMQGWGWAQAHHPDYLDRVVDSWRRALAHGEAWEDTFPLRGRDGSYRWFLSRAMPIRDADGRVVRWFGTNTDVTAQRAVEEELARHKDELEKRVEERTRELRSTYEQLRMSERLATMGVLAAGLGHDMGNLLLPVRVRLESLASEPMSVRAQEDIEAIRTSADYLRRLANGLRLLSLDPQRSSRQETTELHAWWADVQGVFQSVLPRGVELVSALEVGAPAAKVSRASLTQIVFNLVQNAGEALRDRGRGRITVRSCHEAGSVVLSVEDDGPGMSREVRERCMEPYFTTKTRGISTGLGLSLVYGLVREAGGRVDIDAEEGRGARFVLRLAAADPAVDAPPARRSALVEVRDPRLRSLLARELRAMEFDETIGDVRGAEVCVLDDRRRLADVPAGASVLYLGDDPAPGAHRAVSAGSGFGPIREALRAIVAERAARTRSSGGAAS